ncbi:MAG: hypothetical protein HWN66_22065, partial [Candidatus Helarchaeota archaeon]|nr:hypothetical protein [Candidatus Helarchaeota archaeon]
MISLIEDYRVDNGLNYPNSDVDKLIGELRKAVLYDEDIQNPWNRALMEYFRMDKSSHGGFFDISHGENIYRRYNIRELLYGLYMRSSAEFVLNNLGKKDIEGFDDVSLSVKKALIATSEFVRARRWFEFYRPSELNKLLMVTKWYIQGLNHGGQFIQEQVYREYFDISESMFVSYRCGYVDAIRDSETFQKVKEVIFDLADKLNKPSQSFLLELHSAFYRHNADQWPSALIAPDERGLFEVDRGDYSKEFKS